MKTATVAIAVLALFTALLGLWSTYRLTTEIVKFTGAASTTIVRHDREIKELQQR